MKPAVALAKMRYEFDEYPSEEAARAVREWLKFHGLDPACVAIPGWIEVDPEKFAVRALCYIVIFGPNRKRVGVMLDKQLNHMYEVVERRNEGPPLAFPDVGVIGKALP